MGKRYMIWMTMALLLLGMGIAGECSVTVHASTAINTDIQEFNNMDGSAVYINQVDRYYLDMEETGLIDGMGAKVIHDLANVIFTIIKYLGLAVVVLFYQSMNFDIAMMFQDQINGIQSTLNNGIFEPLFILGFCGSSIIIIRKMLRKDLMGSFGQILKVVGIVILSTLIVRHSAVVLSETTTITKAAGTQALVGMQGKENISIASFAAQSSAALWDNLVHDPWVYLEFDGTQNSNDGIVYQFLSLDQESDERKELVENFDGNAFSASSLGKKLGFMILYLVPFLFKCCIYILLALLCLFLQLTAIFYVLLAPVVLLLTMIPGYEGLMNAWLRKLLESQLSILIVYFVIGLLVKFDDMLYSGFSGSWGFLVVLIVQVVVEALVIYKRNELLGAFSNLQKRISPTTAKAMMLRGQNGFQLAERGIKTGSRIKAPINRSGGRHISHVSADAGVRRSQTSDTADTDRRNETMQTERNLVERPVMSAGRQIEIQEQPTMPSRHKSITVNVQKPQEEVKRPRMYENTNDSNIVEFEAYKKRKAAGSENVTEPRKPTQGKRKSDGISVDVNNAGRRREVREEKLESQEILPRPERPVMGDASETLPQNAENVQVSAEKNTIQQDKTVVQDNVSVQSLNRQKRKGAGTAETVQKEKEATSLSVSNGSAHAQNGVRERQYEQEKSEHQKESSRPERPVMGDASGRIPQNIENVPEFVEKEVARKDKTSAQNNADVQNGSNRKNKTIEPVQGIKEVAGSFTFAGSVHAQNSVPEQQHEHENIEYMEVSAQLERPVMGEVSGALSQNVENMQVSDKRENVRQDKTTVRDKADVQNQSNHKRKSARTAGPIREEKEIRGSSVSTGSIHIQNDVLAQQHELRKISSQLDRPVMEDASKILDQNAEIATWKKAEPELESKTVSKDAAKQKQAENMSNTISDTVGKSKTVVSNNKNKVQKKERSPEKVQTATARTKETARMRQQEKQAAKMPAKRPQSSVLQEKNIPPS